MCDRIFIKAEKLQYGLILSLTTDSDGDEEDSGERAIDDYLECGGYDPKFEHFGCDAMMHEFFEDFIANSEWEWISPEEIGALTDAPILGIKDEDGNVLEAYGHMDYAVTSLMEALRHGQVILRKG